jgi:ribosomal protein L37AE/L43A
VEIIEQNNLQTIDTNENQTSTGVKVVMPKILPIAKIPPVANQTLNYYSIKGINRGAFVYSEYDLSMPGKILDSISGDRYTAVKIDGEIKTLSFTELWDEYALTNEVEVRDEREYIYPQNLLVLSGKVREFRSSYTKDGRCCSFNDCNEPHFGRGFCEKHYSTFKSQGKVEPEIEGVWQPCEFLTRHKVSKKKVNFKQKFGFTSVTEDHSLITLEDGKLKEFKAKEEKTLARITYLPHLFGQIREVDLAKYSSYNIEKETISYDGKSKKSIIARFIREDKLEDFCYLLGAFISEGSTTKKKNLTSRCDFRIANTNLEWLKMLQDMFDNIFPGFYSLIFLSDKRSNTYTLNCYSSLISDLFANLCGIGSSKKQIPDFIFGLDNKKVEALKQGLLFGDGHFTHSGYSYTTKSIKLASQYSFLLKLQNIQHSFSYKFDNDTEYYSISTNLSHTHFGTKTKITYEDFNEEYVYDLEVRDTHNFIDLAGQILLHNTEAMVRQAFDKKVALMFKEGWDLVGRNPKTVKYIKIRLAQMARASSIPTDQLIRDIGTSLIVKSNAFLLKVRNMELSGGKPRNVPGILPGETINLAPIACYFSMPAETMEAKTDYDGRIVEWRQRMPYGKMQYYDPMDIVHFAKDRKDGFLFGTPSIVPVIDDIRALRKIEENIELLVYQHLFPLFHVQVGTELKPATIDEAGRDEVTMAKVTMESMPAEGCVVTSERQKISAIGAEGRALRADGYLKHFKQRVIAGLGISGVDLGEGETATRSTADTMSRNLVDGVKDIQQVFEQLFTSYVINELLLESTFGMDVLDEENIVWLRFKEVDIDTQIKKENHQTDMFNKKSITWDECRLNMGKEPIRTPTFEEARENEDTSAKYPEWNKTIWKLFEEPKMVIQSLDEKYFPAVARDNPAIGMNASHVDETDKKIKEERASEFQQKIDMKATKKPEKKKSDKKVKDNFVSEAYQDTQDSILAYIRKTGTSDSDWLSQIIRTQMTPLVDRLVAGQMLEFKQGYLKTWNSKSNDFLAASGAARIYFRERAERYINKLITDTNNSLKRHLKDDLQTDSLLINTRNVFDSLKFRAEHIEDFELNKAFHLGQAVGLRDSGFDKLAIEIEGEACDDCQKRGKNLLSSDVLTLDEVPGYHPGCKCKFKKDGHVVKDYEERKPEEKANIMECKVCKTPMRKLLHIWYCRSCYSVYAPDPYHTNKYQERLSKTVPMEQYGTGAEKGTSNSGEVYR